jgi:hypothetical protein
LTSAATSTLGLGALAAGCAAALWLSGWLELLGPGLIAATFSFLIAWLNRDLVRANGGRTALQVGVVLAGVGTVLGMARLIAEIIAKN